MVSPHGKGSPLYSLLPVVMLSIILPAPATQGGFGYRSFRWCMMDNLVSLQYSLPKLLCSIKLCSAETIQICCKVHAMTTFPINFSTGMYINGNMGIY